MVDYFQEINIKEKYGVVAILDALGTKGSWKKRSSNALIEKWDELVRGYKKAYSKKNRKGYDASFHAFSDTVIITISGTNPNDILLAAGQEISSFVMFSLFRRIFFRGCLSFGKIFAGDQIIIGPAIDEAAQYYESDNWIGISLTPSAIEIVKKPSFQKLLGSKENDHYFVRYSIPMKKTIRRGYALNIKRDYEVLRIMAMTYLRTIPPKQPETLLKQEMRKTSNPAILKKWKNTLKFFENNSSVPLKQTLGRNSM